MISVSGAICPDVTTKEIEALSVCSLYLVEDVDIVGLIYIAFPVCQVNRYCR